MEKRKVQNFSSAAWLWAIVVGNSSDEFIQHTVNLLEDSGVEFVLCDDVYSAVGELAKNRAANALVIGRFEQLGWEQGRFFHMASERGIRCCCLADGNSAQKQRHLDVLGSAAKETAVFVINESSQIESALTAFFADGSALPLREKESRSSNFVKDEFLTTKAELDALFGM